MTAPDTLSIVIPAHNAGSTIGRTIQSLVRQTVPVDQVILVDDDSEDDTMDALGPHLVALRKCVVDVIVQSVVHGGKFAAVEYALGQVTSQWVFILDADDELTNDASEIMRRGFSVSGMLSELCDTKTIVATEYRIVSNRVDDLGDHGDHAAYVSNHLETRFARSTRIRGDRKRAVRTEALRLVWCGSTDSVFTPESLAWNRLAALGDCLYIDRAIYVADYRADGLTANRSRFALKHRDAYDAYYRELYLIHRSSFTPFMSLYHRTRLISQLVRQRLYHILGAQ